MSSHTLIFVLRIVCEAGGGCGAEIVLVPRQILIRTRCNKIIKCGPSQRFRGVFQEFNT